MKQFALPMISAIILSLVTPTAGAKIGNAVVLGQGVNITYEVSITAPPEPAISVKATFSDFTSPLRLEIGYENYPDPTLALLKSLQFSTLAGTILPWEQINTRVIEVNAEAGPIVATYDIDLTLTTSRSTKVSSIGGQLIGYEAFLLPGTQEISTVSAKFTLPFPWTMVSIFPQEQEWFLVQPYTFENLFLETKASGWSFGNVDFDQTKTYPDGFEIRVVGFKYFDYEHWNVYLGNTALEEAMKSADFYHETYAKLKDLYGEFPLSKLILIGPDYWQAGSFQRQLLVGWNRYEFITHHMAHAYFGQEGSRISYSGYCYWFLREGYPTYLEGIMTAEISADPIWRGMLFERKFHYLRGMKFNNLEQNSRQYVLGFIVTYLMDQGIQAQTNGTKGINDLMVSLWQKYNTPNFTRINDDQILVTLQELTGNDWHDFYNQNVVNTNNLDVDALDDLKGDFNLFLAKVADYWYSGHPSMYFVQQEIVASAGDFDFNVRMTPPDLGRFVLAALTYLGGAPTDLSETDIEAILSQVTGKDHSDFFEFYRDQGFVIDPADITEAVKTYTFVREWIDNAIKLTPNTFHLGRSTAVMGELVSADFANDAQLMLQLQVYAKPTGINANQDLISGQGVTYQGTYEFSGGPYGPGANVIFNLPVVKVGEKTYTSFIISLPPQDAGMIIYSFFAKTAEPVIFDWLGGFIGTTKVLFQSGSTFIIKPADDSGLYFIYLPIISRE